MTETDKAWLAALIDSDGCITIQSTKPVRAKNLHYTPVVVVSQTDKGMVERAREIVGAGTLYYKDIAPPNRGVWTWRIRSTNACNVIRDIEPYLILKTKQAAIATALQANIDSRAYCRNRPSEPYIFTYRQHLKEIMRVLNRRGRPVKALQ